MDAGFIYGRDDYFAFVESIDPLISAVAQPGIFSTRTQIILSERKQSNLPLPSQEIWLDCVESRYFMQLPWRDEICRIGNPEDSTRRRHQLEELDRSKFLVSLLLLDSRGAAEGGTAQEFTRSSWHRITLSNTEGLPVLTGTDFDLDDNQQLRFLRYLGRCSDLERRSLANVFSLDFLPDVRLEGDERGSPREPPHTPNRPPRVPVQSRKVELSQSVAQSLAYQSLTRRSR